MALYSTYYPYRFPTCGVGTSGSATEFLLNSAYVHKTSGQGLAFALICPVAGEITDFFVFLNTTYGTRGNITLQCDIYDDTSSTNWMPGSTLLDSSTTTTYPAADTQWIRFQFATPITVSVRQEIYFIIHNTSSSPTVDYPGIRNAIAGGFPYGGDPTAMQTSNGFSSTGSGGGSETPVGYVIDGQCYGQLTTRSASPFTSNSLRRGIRIDAAAGDLLLVGFNAPSTSVTSFEIQSDGVAPGGANLWSFTWPSLASSAHGIFFFDTPFTLNSLGGTPPWRLVYNMGSTTSTPGGGFIDDYSSYSTIFETAIDGVNWCNGFQESGGVWVEYPGFCPIGSFLIGYPQAGGGGLLYPRSFDGGI
jgi:hypothetical protein